MRALPAGAEAQLPELGQIYAKLAAVAAAVRAEVQLLQTPESRQGAERGGHVTWCPHKFITLTASRISRIVLGQVVL